jgi:hypothetical protein
MGLRYRKRIRLGPDVGLNLSRRAASVSAGPRGAKLNVGRRGAFVTLSLLGTGLSYAFRLGRRRR